MNKLKMEQDAMRKATPVARKWMYTQTAKKGRPFAECEDEFMEIMGIEDRLYRNMKDALIAHISRHGLNALALTYFDEFKQINYFDKNKYQSLLSRIRKAYVQNDGDRSLEYLIAKITEFLNKITDLNRVAYEMLMNGQKADFNAWSDKVVLRDNIFEENKQFLKQALHHLEMLEKNNVKMGVPEIRLLLYHKEGCRREKLYRRTEEWILRLYHQLNKEERQSVYHDICTFIKELVPEVGYISPMMAEFIFGNGFLSQASRDLLVSVYPTIKKLSMSPIIRVRLEHFVENTEKHLKAGTPMTETDTFTMELAQMYAPELITPALKSLWDETLK